MATASLALYDAGIPLVAEHAAKRRVVRLRLPARLLITAFLAFHIVAVLLWLTPAMTLNKAFLRLTRNYISWVGLWQNWGMFAPEPSRLNIYISAEIVYRDGTLEEWSFPRMNKLDLFSRYYMERYRKFEEYAHLDSFDGLWPDIAVWVARQHNRNPANPPVRVTLTRHWWIVPPPPPNGDISHDPPHQWNHYTFYSTAITASDLR